MEKSEKRHPAKKGKSLQQKNKCQMCLKQMFYGIVQLAALCYSFAQSSMVSHSHTLVYTAWFV